MAHLDIESLFTFHPASPAQAERYDDLRAAALTFARTVTALTPESAEQTLSIRAIHLASMHATSAIAVNEKVAPDGRN